MVHHHQRVSLHQCSFALVPHSMPLIGHSIDGVPLLGELQLVPWVGCRLFGPPGESVTEQPLLGGVVLVQSSLCLTVEQCSRRVYCLVFK